jgi:hypothetical protein
VRPRLPVLRVKFGGPNLWPSYTVVTPVGVEVGEGVGVGVAVGLGVGVGVGVDVGVGEGVGVEPSSPSQLASGTRASTIEAIPNFIVTPQDRTQRILSRFYAAYLMKVTL